VDLVHCNDEIKMFLSGSLIGSVEVIWLTTSLRVIVDWRSVSQPVAKRQGICVPYEIRCPIDLRIHLFLTQICYRLYKVRQKHVAVFEMK